MDLTYSQRCNRISLWRKCFSISLYDFYLIRQARITVQTTAVCVREIDYAFLLFAIVALPLIMINTDSDISKHPIPTTSFKGSSQEKEAINNLFCVPDASFQNREVINAQSPHVPTSTDTTTAMDLAFKSNVDPNEELNKSGASYVRPCSRWDTCFKLGCDFRHPLDWYVCKTGLNCAVFLCKGTHPYKRVGPCRYGEKCLDNNCKWLHSQTRSIESLQTNEYRQSEYNKAYPTDQPNQFHAVPEKHSQSQPDSRSYDTNLDPNVAKCINRSSQYPPPHVPHQTSQAKQLTIGKFQKCQKSKQSEEIDFFLLLISFFTSISAQWQMRENHETKAMKQLEKTTLHSGARDASTFFLSIASGSSL